MVIAIIAHDGKKAEMVQFLNEQEKFLHKNEIQLLAFVSFGAAAFSNDLLHSILSLFT